MMDVAKYYNIVYRKILLMKGSYGRNNFMLNR